MKRLLFIFILILGVQTWTKADDISDFEIEGMSIGDSLLDYMSLDEINENIFKNYYKNGKKRKYYATGYFSTKQYDQLEIYIKTGDNNYQIKAISGFKVIKDLKKCISTKKKIVDQIQALFVNIDPVSYDDVVHSFDKSGESKQYQTAFLLKSQNSKDHIRIECTKWSKKMKEKNSFGDTLGVSAFSTETLMWVKNDYQ